MSPTLSLLLLAPDEWLRPLMQKKLAEIVPHYPYFYLYARPLPSPVPLLSGYLLLPYLFYRFENGFELWGDKVTLAVCIDGYMLQLLSASNCPNPGKQTTLLSTKRVPISSANADNIPPTSSNAQPVRPANSETNSLCFIFLLPCHTIQMVAHRLSALNRTRLF